VRRLAFIVDLVNVFGVLRTENDRSAVALRDCKSIRHKRINVVCVMLGVNGVDGA